MEPTITALDGETGLEIRDPIENARFVLYSTGPVSPRRGSPAEMGYPVETVVRVAVSGLRVPVRTSIYLHSAEGFVESWTPAMDPLQLRESRTLEVNSAPVKLYLDVAGPARVCGGEESVWLEFESETKVVIGVRSLHDRPAGTITTTPSPEGAMQAVSLLGSALKTTSPERSFPTLRGHPPLVETGDTFEVPGGIERPETGVRVEVPAAYEYVFPVAPLAYYLGAELVQGGEPRLVTDQGFEYGLDGPRGYEATVGRVLRQTFFLDCLTRTEGLYPVDLAEREAVESRLDVDFAELYERPLADRLETHLSVTFDRLEEYVPEWTLTVDVDPSAESLGAVPFVVDELGLVRVADWTRPDASRVVRKAADEFHRARSNGGSSRPAFHGDLVTPASASTTTQAWVGDGIPIGANKLTVEALQQSLPVDVDESCISVHVVCNDDRMREEGIVEDYYAGGLQQIETTRHDDLTTGELRELLAEPADFLHFVGHADESGLRCPDGVLDARTVSDVNVSAFVLNACESYEQGEALVEAGSLGGVITLWDVDNTAATRVGNALARTLAAGYSLRLGVEVARNAIESRFAWTTVGNGGIALCQCTTGTPLYFIVDSVGRDTYRTEVRMYPSPSHGLGAAFQLYLDQTGDQHYLAGRKIGPFDLSGEQLDDLLQDVTMPVKIDGELCWSSSLVPVRRR